MEEDKEQTMWKEQIEPNSCTTASESLQPTSSDTYKANSFAAVQSSNSKHQNLTNLKVAKWWLKKLDADINIGMDRLDR